MLNKFTLRLTIVLAAALLIAPIGFAAEKYDVTADEVFDPMNTMGNGPVGILIPGGTVKCPGHEPVGDPTLPPCPAGSRTHIRNTMVITRVNSDDERVAGDMTVTLNANWNANFAGPIWGTFSIELDSGGTWVGTWEGLRVFEDPYWSATLHVNGQGFGGLVEGMHMMAEDYIEGQFPMPIAYVGLIKGRIIDPN